MLKMLPTIGEVQANLVVGIVLGAIYALMAVGLTTIWTTTGTPDFSQAGIYVLAAYVGYLTVTFLNLPFFIALVAAMGAGGLAAVAIEKYVYMPIRAKMPPAWMHTPLIAAIALYYFIENLHVSLFTAKAKFLSSPYLGIIFDLGVVRVSLQRLLILIIGISLFIIAGTIIKKTWTGKSLRAASQNRDAAKLMGVNIDRVHIITFLLAGSFSACAGVLVSPLYAIWPAMGLIPLLKALVVVVLGGLGSFLGAILAGFTLGIIEALGISFISAEFQHGYAFFVLIIVLWLRPKGLFGLRPTF